MNQYPIEITSTGRPIYIPSKRKELFMQEAPTHVKTAQAELQQRLRKFSPSTQASEVSAFCIMGNWRIHIHTGNRHLYLDFDEQAGFKRITISISEFNSFTSKMPDVIEVLQSASMYRVTEAVTFASDEFNWLTEIKMPQSFVGFFKFYCEHAGTQINTDVMRRAWEQKEKSRIWSYWNYFKQNPVKGITDGN